MNCLEAQELLSAYTDRELPADQMRLVEEHLRTCAECANASSMTSQLSRLAKRWEGVRSSTAFHERVLEGARRAPPARRASGALLVAVAVFLLGGGAVGLGLHLRGASPGGEAPARLAAVCRALRGRVWVLPPAEGATLSPLRPGEWLEEGSRVRVERGGGAELDLAAGGLVALREMTEAELAQFGLRLEGEGAVAVKTPSTVSWLLRLTGPGFEVDVWGGSVAFVRPGAGGSLHVSVLKGRATVDGLHRVDAGTELVRDAMGRVKTSPLSDETVFGPFRD